MVPTQQKTRAGAAGDAPRNCNEQQQRVRARAAAVRAFAHLHFSRNYRACTRMVSRLRNHRRAHLINAAGDATLASIMNAQRQACRTRADGILATWHVWRAWRHSMRLNALSAL